MALLQHIEKVYISDVMPPCSWMAFDTAPYIPATSEHHLLAINFTGAALRAHFEKQQKASSMMRSKEALRRTAQRQIGSHFSVIIAWRNDRPSERLGN